MEKLTYIIIIGIGLAIILLAIFFKKTEWLANFVFRGLLGVILLYCINSVLVNFGVKQVPGINEINIASIGLLGMPGIFMLYAIMVYYNVRG
ncbi:pro-sigmaK processing inhibitor BofA family protein [Anaerosporobacter sp.]|uniref:pro-sigmaK processing inhibitor BofA family protein n=1 Tax=Anaerosporobacter sp. TaxID=1872529 RepID=UPI00286F08E2|nr:pro-sigmaK processing inhibitor BofA family protein [Anaerosporobacter sp.]